MILSQKSLECLREMINEKTDYRKGWQLVAFFNELGSHDHYGQGFPTRSIYTDNKLLAINGTFELDKCVKKVFAPINFVNRLNVLSACLNEFNQYLAYDGWKVEVKNTSAEIHHCGTPDIEAQLNKVSQKETNVETEMDFLSIEFGEINIDALPIEENFKPIIALRLEEVRHNIEVNANLSAIIMIGSILEGVLLGSALNDMRTFNQAKNAPKNKDGKNKHFQDWKLSEFIDVANEIGYLKEDVKKFSHVVRDFRNYIHPYQQYGSHFFPDEYTVKICFQVLKAALHELSFNTKNNL